MMKATPSASTQKARELLTEGISCVIVKGNNVYTSKKTGIAPLMELIDKGCDEYSGASVADKIVGKAAAMLFCKIGITSVYAKVISRPGLEYLRHHGVNVSYEILTERIINRVGNDVCPMEKAVTSVSDYNEGYYILKQRIEELKK